LLDNVKWPEPMINRQLTGGRMPRCVGRWGRAQPAIRAMAG